LASCTELGLANENGIAEGAKITFFNTNQKYITGVSQWLRTPYTSQSAYSHFIDGGGSLGSDLANGAKAVRPILNVSGNTVISQTANASGYYTLM
jgi:hypothetical protein